MRLIDADKLKAHYAWWGDEYSTDGSKKQKELFDIIVDLQPTADERRHGEWIVHENQRQEDVDNGNYLYVCSECGKSDIHAKTQKVPFCWWCGARMEGDK